MANVQPCQTLQHISDGKIKSQSDAKTVSGLSYLDNLRIYLTDLGIVHHASIAFGVSGYPGSQRLHGLHHPPDPGDRRGHIVHPDGHPDHLEICPRIYHLGAAVLWLGGFDPQDSPHPAGGRVRRLGWILVI